MESCIVQIKLCEENHRVQSKIFSMEFRFETKLCCFVTRYVTSHIYTLLFVHIFSELTMTSDLLWKGCHVPIFRVIFVISTILISVDNFHVETLIDSKQSLLMVFII